MLAEMLERSLTEMTLNSRGHGRLLAGQGKLVAEVFARDKECCHLCGFSIPGHMEIDHLAGHRPSKASQLKTICQFCHNLRHPLWAGARKRIIPISAPELSQADLHRLAWTLLAWRDVEEGPIDAGAITGLIDARREAFRSRFGTDRAEVLFESVWMACEVGSRKANDAMLARIDMSLRFWPAELLPEAAEFDPASRLSRWMLNGFVPIADEAAAAIRDSQTVSHERIRSAMQLALEKGAERLNASATAQEENPA